MAWTETPAEAFRRNQLMKLGFEESGVKLEEYDMCEACKDAVAVDRARGYRVCRDCYYEMGV
tara:strand:- start:383 stop:568 length:186 start_codon:yes stop_codon:yes gene_type:complete